MARASCLVHIAGHQVFHWCWERYGQSVHSLVYLLHHHALRFYCVLRLRLALVMEKALALASVAVVGHLN